MNIRETILNAIANDRPPRAESRRGPKPSVSSLYRIARKTGIEQSTLSRFVYEGTGLNLETLQKLCDYLGLELTPKIDVSPPRSLKDLGASE